MPMPKTKQIRDMILEANELNPHLPMRFAIELVLGREGFSAIDVISALFDPDGNDALSEVDEVAAETLLDDATRQAEEAVKDNAETKQAEDKLAADKKTAEDNAETKAKLAANEEARKIQAASATDGSSTASVGTLVEEARVEPGTPRARELAEHQGAATADAAGNTPGVQTQSAHDKHATTPGLVNKGNADPGDHTAGKTGENTPMSKEVAAEQAPVNKLADAIKASKK